MYIGLHEKYPLCLSGFNAPCIILTDFRKKRSNTIFHENPPSESPVVPCGQMERERQMVRRDEDNSRFSQNFKKRLKTCARYEVLTVVLVKTLVIGVVSMYTDKYSACTRIVVAFWIMPYTH
jgi:hypothetical protein